MPSLLDLPDELLVQVIDDAVPTAMGSEDDHKERCRTLLAVMLTSKRPHALALPLLYRVLRVTESRFRPIMAARKGAEGRTYPSARTLVCDGEGDARLAADLLSFAVAAAPRVSDMRVYRCGDIALAELQALSALTSLTLYNILNTTVDPGHVQSLRLPHVIDLSLSYLYCTQSGVAAFLSSATFPSLRHVSFGWMWITDDNGAGIATMEVVPLICPALLAQLRSLRCWHASHSSDFSFPHSLQVLHDSSHLALLSRGLIFPDHFPLDRTRLANAKGALKKMAASLSRVADGARPPLKLVLLDSDLLEHPDAIAELKPTMDAFLEACKAAEVEVIVQGTPQYGFESLVSKRFIRWCEEKYGTQ
ncbi:hypothetical protein JCM10213v2_008360 [Rhodosporidiobolus nylandii]